MVRAKKTATARIFRPLLGLLVWALIFVSDWLSYAYHYLLLTGVQRIAALFVGDLVYQRTTFKSYSPSHLHAVFISGCSTGIGRHAALVLAQAGYKVFAGVRRSVDGDGLQAELRRRTAGVHQEVDELTPCGIQPVLCDVADGHQVTSCFQTIRKDLERTGGKLIAVVNNAGILYEGPLELVDIAKARKCMDVNAFGVMRVRCLYLERVQPLIVFRYAKRPCHYSVPRKDA